MTVKDAVQRWLELGQYDGLRSADGECECLSGDDLMMCREFNFRDCELVKHDEDVE